MQDVSRRSIKYSDDPLLSVRDGKCVIVGNFGFINPISDLIFIIILDIASKTSTREVHGGSTAFSAALVQIGLASTRGR